MNKKSVLKVVVVVIVVAGASFLGRLGFDLISKKNNTFHKVLMQTASELNKNCPLMVDQETRLDNAIALPGNVFQYNYTLVNYVMADLNIDQIKANIAPGMLNNIKSNDGLKTFRENKVTFEYVYKDKTGVVLFSIVFKPSDYLTQTDR